MSVVSYIFVVGLVLINLSILFSLGINAVLFTSGVSCIVFAFGRQMYKDMNSDEN